MSKNPIVGLTIEADRTYFSDPVRFIVSRFWRGGRPSRVYAARPASAIRAARAVLAHVQSIVARRAPAALPVTDEPGGSGSVSMAAGRGVRRD